MSFISHIYDRQEIEENENDWPIFFLLILSLLLGYLLTDVLEALGTTIMILTAIGTYIYLYKDWGKKEAEGKYVGKLILTSELFTLNDETINTSEVNELKIEIGHTKGYKHWHRYGYTICSGTTSKLQISVKGVKRSWNFQLLAQAQVKDLKGVLEELYDKGIFIKEYYLGNRTYLLEELNYEDIQEFKKKYKLS